MSAKSVIEIGPAVNLGEMIKLGGYNFVNPDLTEQNFPVPQRGSFVQRFDTNLFNFHKDQKIEEAQKLIEVDGWKLARIEHLLAWGIKCFDIKMHANKILALGSMKKFGADPHFPCLSGEMGDRSADLYFVSTEETPVPMGISFLAVKML